MNYIEVKSNDEIAQYVQGPLGINECIEYHWEKDVLDSYHYRSKRDAADSLESQTIYFSVNDNCVELSESKIIGKPVVNLVSKIGGQAKTLSMTCQFLIPHILTKGNLRLYSSSTPADKLFNYELEVKDVKIKFDIGYFVIGFGFEVKTYLYEILETNTNFTYKDGSKLISVLDDLKDDVKKNTILNYLIENICAEIFEATKQVFLQPLYDRGSIPNELGVDDSLRDPFRIHLKYLHAAFKVFIDKMLGIANDLITSDSSSVTQAKVMILNNKHGSQKSMETFDVTVQNLGCLEYSEMPIIFVENDTVILYVPVKFKEQQVIYKQNGKRGTLKLLGSYIKLTIKRLGEKKAEINILDFKIKKIEFNSSFNGDTIICYPEIILAMEAKIKNCLCEAVKNDDLNSYALDPPGVKIEYDSEDFLYREESDEES